ncbi:MAG TPA: GTPase Era, partial [Cyclobacteriaceae bacterium]
MTTISHKAGFVSIIGKPNVGKSTLMNQLVGEKLSIITSKAQTTRHRILGILSGENFQIVYSDTPGIIKPAYKLQESMMTFVKTAVSDADIIIYIVELGQKFDPDDEVIRRIKKSEKKLILVINKVDLDKDKLLE